MATILIRDMDDALLDRLKEYTGEAAGTRAILAACRSALVASDYVDSLTAYAQKLAERDQVRTDLLSRLEPILVRLLEDVTQGDMFSAFPQSSSALAADQMLASDRGGATGGPCQTKPRNAE
jgi:hypothetical protein